MNSIQKGFTLLEIMMVIAIIALLALIATPHVQHMKMTTNDTLAIKTLRALSTASESFAVNNANVYPTSEAALMSATPPYLSRSYCGQAVFGFYFNCWFPPNGYYYQAMPVQPGVSGTTSYTIYTGGVLFP